jgi:hypothetical protein
MYRNDLSQMVLTPQLQQLIHFGNNDNSNNNGNDNNNNSNGNSNNGNNNGNAGSNSGNVNNSNPPVTNPTNSFGGSGQFDVTVQNSGSPAGINANVNCLVSQNGNNIQLGLDLFPTSVPSSLQSTFSDSDNSDYLFNFDGTTSNTDSGTQITANAQGSLSSANTFNLDLNGTIDQNQDTFTLTLTSQQNSQMAINTPQAISLHPNNNNSNNNNSSSSNNPNNNSGGVTPVFQGGQINTAQKTITLTFSVTNGLSHDTTINSMSGTLEITADQYSLGTVSSTGPVTIPSGQTATITVSGTLTQNDLNYLNNHYSHASSLDVTVVNGKMTEDGVTNQGAQSQDLGNIPIS